MTSKATRKPCEGEVLALLSDDGQNCITIVKRSDGLFWCFEHVLIHDQDEDVYYWNAVQGPYSGIYGTIEEAERDVRSRLSEKRYPGMTTNERLFNAGLLEQFDAAFRHRDREEMIRLLASVELADQSAHIADTLLANPARYGH